MQLRGSLVGPSPNESANARTWARQIVAVLNIAADAYAATDQYSMLTRLSEAERLRRVIPETQCIKRSSGL